MSSKILLKQGVLLLHNSDNHVVPTPTDLLIEGSKIAAIGPDIQAPAGAKVIDCAGNIVSPGFISTHNHLYQTPLKGLHANDTLIEYFPKGNYAASFFSLEDLFWGQLGGALEALDAGTTTVVDHASLNLSPDYSKTAVQALLSAGIRSVYCPQVPRNVESWSPFKASDDFDSPWVMESFRALAGAAPYGEGRVLIGYANDNVYMPGDAIKAHYAEIHKAGAHLITTHSVGGPSFGAPASVAQILAGHDLLDSKTLLSHANFPRAGDGELLRKTGATISTTPNTEMQMGWPLLGLDPDFEANASLGVDCHTWGSASMTYQMRLQLQSARLERSNELYKDDKWSRHTGHAVEQVFNLATIGGAKAAGLADQIGRLEVGKQADIVIFDSGSPSMVVAAKQDPVAAVVLHSNPRDVQTVIVNGIVRKDDGRLLDVKVADPLANHNSPVQGGRVVTWRNVSQELLASRARLIPKIQSVDTRGAEDVIMDMYFMRKENLVENE